jgi:hypothetical protein
MGLHKFGHKLKKASHFGNKGLKRATRVGMKAGKVVEKAGMVGEELGVPMSGEVVMAGRKTQQVSKKVERVRRGAAKATRGF